MWPPHSVTTWRTSDLLEVRARVPNVDDFELESIRIFEEDGVVAGAVLGELARRLVEGGESARGEEVFGEAVDVVAVGDAEGEVVEAGALAVKARGGVTARRSR